MIDLSGTVLSDYHIKDLQSIVSSITSHQTQACVSNHELLSVVKIGKLTSKLLMSILKAFLMLYVDIIAILSDAIVMEYQFQS